VTASEIRPGMTLKLKSDRQEAYGFETAAVNVTGLYYKGGYKTPWVQAVQGSFRPSDFAARIDTEEA
jgi:hypothetical protein